MAISGGRELRARSVAYLMSEAMKVALSGQSRRMRRCAGRNQWPIMAHEAMCRTRRVLVEERLEGEKKSVRNKR